MSLKVKSNGTSKYVLIKNDLSPSMTNFTATAGPKISASEITMTKIGPMRIISLIVKATTIINAGDVIINLPDASSANFSTGVVGNGGQYGVQIAGSSVKAINAIPANEWIRGQIIYPSEF